MRKNRWIVQETQIPHWQAFATLDDIATSGAALADQRLTWQAQFATHTG